MTVLPERVRFLQQSMDLVAGVPGCFVECGVRYGRTFALLAEHAALSTPPRTLWGFDSWAPGHPLSVWDTYLTNWGTLKPDIIERKIVQRGLKPLDVSYHLVKGFVEDTLVRTSTGPVALIHADVGLYSGTRAIMHHLWPRLVVGGVVVFDHYHRGGGEKRAVDEYLADYPHEMREGYRWLAIKTESLS